MARHTQSEYGKLLKEQLEKLGMRVGLKMEMGERGWEGSMILARGEVRCEGRDAYVAELLSDVFLYVDDEGAIRIYYSEQIIVDPEKKAKYDAWQEESRRCEEERQLHPENYPFFDPDYDSEDCGEVSPAEEAAEDLVNMSEKQELALLRALNEIDKGIVLYAPKNETRLVYHGRYRMEACGRNSAKKAAVYICDELFVICGYMEYLSRQQNFVRVKPSQPWNGWTDENILDDFSQINDFIALRVKQRIEEENALRYADGYVSRYEWMRAYADDWKDGWKEEWGDPREVADSIRKRMDEHDPNLTFSEIIKCGAAYAYLKQKLEREIAGQQSEQQE